MYRLIWGDFRSDTLKDETSPGQNIPGIWNPGHFIYLFFYWEVIQRERRLPSEDITMGKYLANSKNAPSSSCLFFFFFKFKLLSRLFPQFHLAFQSITPDDPIPELFSFYFLLPEWLSINRTPQIEFQFVLRKALPSTTNVFIRCSDCLSRTEKKPDSHDWKEGTGITQAPWSNENTLWSGLRNQLYLPPNFMQISDGNNTGRTQ